ncbi:MAG: hypothetical protein Q8P41_32350 [Pseudomonadota bacterium]|nr:hypothetical protein [Pseudomonadota bacterium]
MLLLLAAACDADPVPPVATDPVDEVPAACVGAPAVTWESWGEGFFRTYCNACHAADTPDRRGAPAGVDFDTWAGVTASSARVRARVLEEGTMPVGGGLDPDELALLEVLLTCAR